MGKQDLEVIFLDRCSSGVHWQQASLSVSLLRKVGGNHDFVMSGKVIGIDDVFVVQTTISRLIGSVMQKDGGIVLATSVICLIQ